MASAFSTQLRRIAANSSNELDLKAQKASHSESLIFEKKIAGSQDFETIYQICLEGFQELCQLDARFCDFERNLFSPQSRNQDRTQMTAQENEALNTVLELFLGLIGSRLLLLPAIKAVEWLVRRFKVHTFNTSFVLSTFLPYYDLPIFRNLLSIVPKTLPSEYKCLGPYLKTATNPPRHVIAYSAANSNGFFDTLNAFALQLCRAGSAYPALLSFWSSIVIEAVANRLNLSQSGRREVQQQRQEDLLLQVLPLLNDGLSFRDVPDMTFACYTISIILTTKGSLAENVLDSLMEAVAATLTYADVRSGLLCLVIIANHKSEPLASKGVVSSLSQVREIENVLKDLGKEYPINILAHALIRGSLNGLKKKNSISRISFIERILCSLSPVSDSSSLSVLFKDLLEKVQELGVNDPRLESIKAHLLDMLRRLNESDEFSPAIGLAVAGSGKDPTYFESVLGSVLNAGVENASDIGSTVSLEAKILETPTDSLEKRLRHVPERTVDCRSFLTSAESHLFVQLADAFVLCCGYQGGPTKFSALPIWQSDEPEAPLYISFLLKMAFGPYAGHCRAAALKLITEHIRSQLVSLDAQALLPYLAVGLADASQIVRKASAHAVEAVEEALPKDLAEGGSCSQWGSSDLYGDAESMVTVRWMPPQQVVKVLRGAFYPVLEECILDATQITRAFQSALQGSSRTIPVSSQNSSIGLKKGLRQMLFELLTKHLIVTPLLKVKIELIHLLSGVEKVGSVTKSKTLMPVLQQWSSLSSETVNALAAAERLSLPEIDKAMTEIISASDKDGVIQLLALLMESREDIRSGFINAVFDRISGLWKGLKAESRIAVTKKLFDMSLSNSVQLSSGASNLLRSLPLSTESLSYMIKEASAKVTNIPDGPHITKRRRLSHGQGQVSSDAVQYLHSVVSCFTFVLELLDSSNPESHPQLLGELFQVLTILQQLGKQARSEYPYLLHLCLSSILAIVQKAQASPKSELDLSTVRIDLITDCVRFAENPQVQNTALLLTSALANITPERVLHNVMPIFTFMGKSVLGKDDDHSVLVINQTIDQTIPPLIGSLREGHVDSLITPTSELLASFTAAYDHIPHHRRLGLFQRLVSRLGAEDFLYAIIAMLAIKDSGKADTKAFIVNLAESFNAHAQLVAYNKLTGLVFDILGVSNEDTKIIVGISSSSPAESKREAALTLFSATSRLLEGKNLRTQVRKLHKLEAESAERLRRELKTGFDQALELVRDTREDESICSAARHCLTALLDLPSLVEYFDLLPDLLEEAKIDIKPDVLRTLEHRLLSNPGNGLPTQIAALSFLSKLTNVLSATENITLKCAALSCIDRISEIYGRKDIPAVVTTMRTLAAEECFGLPDSRLRTMALLCLASMLEVVKEAIIPVVPDIMHRIFQNIEWSISDDIKDMRLHNAAYHLLSAMISHVSFMISEGQLDSILNFSAESAFAELGEECDNTRRDVLSLLARKIEVRQVVSVLDRTWNKTVENGVEAVREVLSVLTNSIDRSSKSQVVRNSDAISRFILQVLDLRRVQFTGRSEDSYAESEITEVEATINVFAIGFIYKLNDTVFRPLFAQWVDWAVENREISSEITMKAKILRQTSLFSFLSHFFNTLKSIVTSYASYVVEPAVRVLKSVAEDILSKSPSESALQLLDPDQLSLYLSTLSALRAACIHDADSFFASSSRFSLVSDSLTAQLHLASYKSFNRHVYTHVIPTIVALATAVIDNTAHNSVLNKQICALRKSDSSAVRLASIKLQMALAESEEIGDDWVSSVVGTGGDTMVYVNEMLEDDNEEVERNVRGWIRLVRDKVGEDIFEV